MTSQPLNGIRIVELAGLGPGPYGVMLLADLGADVVRVDRVSGARGLSEWTVGLMRGRRSIALDLKRSEAVDVVRRLVKAADVLVESNRPGVAERLGLGPDVCCADNPALVYARMTGWGQEGPLSGAAGHDLNYIAVAGALFDIGRADSPPPPPQSYIGDYGGGGTFLAIGVLAALFERTKSGRGQVIDAAVLDGVASLTAFSHGLAHLGVWGTERGTTPADGSMPFYDTYETADGEYLAVGALEPKFYAVLLERLGVPAERFPQDDRSCWPQLRAALSGAFRSRTRDDWDKEFQGLDACVTPVLRLREAPDHPHNQARNLFVEVAGQLQPNVAPRLSRTPGEVGTAPPAQGADTVSVLRELDYSDAEIRDLLNSGVARQAADAGQHPDDSGERESRVSVSIAPGR